MIAIHLMRRRPATVFGMWRASPAPLAARVALAALLGVASGVGAASVLSPSPAAAQSREWVNPDVIDLRDQLETLQREVARMQGGGVGGGDFSGGGDFRRLDSIENALRQLTGQVEEMQFRSAEAIRRRDAVINTLGLRVQALEEQLGIAGAASAEPLIDSADLGPARSAPSNVGAGLEPAGSGLDLGSAGLGSTGLGSTGLAAAAPQTLDENLLSGGGAAAGVLGSIQSDQPNGGAAATPLVEGGAGGGSYEQALDALRGNQLDVAEANFRAFIDGNPNDPRVGEATFWLGETYYARGRFDAAARTYLDSFRNYPQSAKAPDSLLRLGMTLAQLEQVDEACLTFNEVAARYPNAPARVLRKAESEAQTAGCL